MSLKAYVAALNSRFAHVLMSTITSKEKWHAKLACKKDKVELEFVTMSRT